MIYHRREKGLFEKGYYVDKAGNLYNPSGGIIIGTLSREGRRYTGIRDFDGKVRSVAFHRMVAYAKYGDDLYDDNMLVRHLDGNPSNNSWDNIAIGTPHDNMMDICEDVRMRNAGMANQKYPLALVEYIRSLHNKGWSFSKLMAKFNITSKGTMSYLVNKRIY
jgi:hypothetical protein